MNIAAQLTCEICQDTWFRDMDDRQLADFMAENRGANFRRITEPNDGALVDIDGIICDGCEDYYQDEAALAIAWDEYYDALAEDEEVETQHLDELKEEACAATGTGEFALWDFDPELGDNK